MSLFAQRIKQAKVDGNTNIIDLKTGLPKTFAVSTENPNNANHSQKENSIKKKEEEKHELMKLSDDLSQKDSLSQKVSDEIQEKERIDEDSQHPSDQKIIRIHREEKSEEPKLLDVLSESDIDIIHAQNMQTLSKMDPQELEKQKQMLFGLLSKDNINFLKQNKGYLESRKQEIKVSKGDKKQNPNPEDFLTPKTKSAKQLFQEKHAATQSIKGIMPDLSPEMFEEDNFEQLFYACYYDNTGRMLSGLSKEILDQTSNVFDVSKNDEFHTWSDLFDLLDSTHPGHIVFALDKIASILKLLASEDLDYVEGFPTGGKKWIRVSKMKMILGLVQTAWLDKRMAFLTAKKNLNIFNAVLTVTKWFLRWLTNRSIMIGRKSPEVMAQVITLVMGKDKELNQIELEFLKPAFTTPLLQLAASQDNYDVLGLLFEVLYYLRFMAPSQKEVIETTKMIVERMKNDVALNDKLIEVENSLQSISTFQTLQRLDLTNASSIFEQIHLYRSNLKNGSKLNSLSIKLLSDAFTLIPAEKIQPGLAPEILSGLFDIHTFAAISILYGPSGVVHPYLSLLPVLHAAGERLSNQMSTSPLDLQKRLMLHVVDSRHFEAVYSSTLQTNSDVHFEAASKRYGSLDSEVLFEGEGEQKKIKIRPSLLSLELFTDSLPEILSSIYPVLSNAEKLMVFADLVRFYSSDDSGNFMTTKELLDIVLKQTDKEFLKEAIRQICVNESLVKALMDNYRYCSFGDPGFTALLFLFTSKHGKLTLAK